MVQIMLSIRAGNNMVVFQRNVYTYASLLSQAQYWQENELIHQITVEWSLNLLNGQWSLFNKFQRSWPDTITVSVVFKHTVVWKKWNTQMRTKSLRNVMYSLNGQWWRFPPGWEGFHPGGKVSNQVKRFPPRWKGFIPGEKVSTRVER